MTNLLKSFFFFLLVFTCSNLWAQIPFKHVVIDMNAPTSLWGKGTGDLNNDGFPDLLAGGKEGGGLVWYEYPTWTKHAISPDDIGTDIETADIDQDGKLDVIAIGNNTFQWYKNPGWEKFVIESGIRLHDIEVADFNGDGKMDLIGRNQEYGDNSGDVLHLYIQGTTSADWNHLTFSGPKGEGLKVHDIDMDGKPDVIIGGIWYENTGDMNNWVNHIFSSLWNYRQSTIATGDINGDGKSDIIISPSEQAGDYYKIAWYEHPSDPTSTWPEHIVADNVETIHHSIGTADFNNDGKTDIATAEMEQGVDPDEVAVFINQDNGTNWEKQVLATTGSHIMKIVDIGSDGNWDLFGGNWNGVGKAEIWMNESDLGLSPSGVLDNWVRLIIDPAKEWTATFIDGKDLNGDGLKDIITGGWWYENHGSAEGNWTKHTIGSPLYNMAYVYDFDGDGDMDLLGTEGQGSNSSATFVWAENDGKGDFTIHNNIENAKGDFLQGVAVLRKNDESPYKVALSWHTSGYGVQTLTVPIDPVSDTWIWEKISDISQDECLTSGDINQDGNPDLLMGTKWLQNMGGSWSLNTLFNTTGLPDRNKLADINRDGRMDAVIGYEAISILGKLVWYEQSEVAKNSWTEHLIANVVGPMSMDAVDMDGDNDIDVVVGEHNLSVPDNAKMLIFENLDGKGSVWLKHQVYQGDEHHDGAVTVDIDNDGDLDILSIGWGHNKVLLYKNKSIISSISSNLSSVPSVKLNVYPNPANDKVTISLTLPQQTKIKITICDLSGKKIYSESGKQNYTGNFQKTLPTTNWNSGIYIVKVQTDLQVFTQKIFTIR